MNACWPRWKRSTTSPRPTIRPTSRRCGCCTRIAGDSAGGRVRDRLSRDDPAGPAALRGAAGMGREATASSAGASTGPAIATSPSARRSCSDNPEAKIISCHLGGSSSLCAIAAGKSVATSMGMSPQSGSAAEQPRRRFRSVRLAGHHAGHGQDARTGAGRPGQSLGLARTERPQRSARHRRGGGRAATRRLAAGPRRLCRQRCGITSARICCC